ncbi:response regulator [Belliella kenyensis]|uniref:Response regulator n=1 Tax=Belliella kenyensis TaxID=1472724 RepID=A0ABV8ERU5_9BACT|nr:response regulator [Belliella kenyensis]MCH7401972.1 response regulator [Belliella kenyensis]MDN3605136.1 response regulator [Belliella kenyensis]
MYQFYSIILVDDDPINNLINKRLITKMNIAEQVEEYLEAEKALARLANISPDEKTLILLDINMPVMNGWDFLNQYLEKNQHRKDKIIMLSSSIDFQDQQKAKKYDCVEGFIEKPLTPDKFKNLL